MDKYKLVVWGGNEEAYKNSDKEHSIESAIVFFKNGASMTIDFADYAEFVSFYSNLVNNGLNQEDMLSTLKGYGIYEDLALISESKSVLTDELKAGFFKGKTLSEENRQKFIDKIEASKEVEIPEPIFADPELETMETTVEEDKKENNTLKKVAIGIGGTAAAAGIVAGVANLAGCGNDAEIQPIETENITEDKNTLENAEVVVEIPSMVGKDFAYYAENAIDTDQKDFFTNYSYAWLNRVNAQEDWQRVTLEAKKAEELGYTNPECIFGFTAEDTYALALRFGKYTNDQYVSLAGGKDLDVVDIMDDAHSQSNEAITKIITYYLNSNNCDLHIETVINFNEEEMALNSNLEQLLREYKELVAQKGKEKEAFAKMQEFKKAMQELAYNTNPEIDNFKSYALRTFLPAASVLSQLNQYKDTISIDLIDVNKNQQVSKEVKTDLFDELTMRTLILGFDETFDSEQYLENLKLSSKEYNLLYNDVEQSIADKSCGAQSERLQQANEYIVKLKMENLAAETIAAEQRGITDTLVDNLNNVRTRYDELTYGTYDYDVIIQMINAELVNNNIYPMNIQYFNTTYIAEKQIEYKNNHGITRGKPGDKIVVSEEKQKPVTEDQLSAPGSVVVDSQGNQISAEEAMAQARQKEAQATGIPDASTEEAAKAADEAAMNSEEYHQLESSLQSTYDDVKSNIVSGDGSKADINSSNNAIKFATEDGLNEKKIDEEIKAHPTVGGQTTILPGFEDVEIYDTPQAPVVSVDRTTKMASTYAAPVEAPIVETTTSETTTESTTQQEEGITNVDPTLNNPTFAPVVYSDAEINQLISEFSESDFTELFGEENIDGFSK